jgi:signal transduction histidine kinase/ActR/RegA family two-component response regulator
MDNTHHTRTEIRRMKPGLVPTVAAYILLALICLLIISLVIHRSLTDISATATATRDDVLPVILDRQRTAVNLERLGRFAETVYRSTDERTRRQFKLAAHILSQDSVFENDQRINHQVVNAFKEIDRLSQLRDRQMESDLHSQAVLRQFAPASEGAQGLAGLRHGRELGELLFRADQASTRKELAALRREFTTLAQAGPVAPRAAEALKAAGEFFQLREDSLAIGEACTTLWRGVNESLEQMADNLSINAAITAEERFTSIAGLSDEVIRTGALAMGTLILGLGILLYFAQRDIVLPILRYVQGLERFAAGQRHPNLPRARLKELDSIRSAVERSGSLMAELAQQTQELQDTNKTLESEVRVRRETERELAIAKERAESADRAKSEFLAGMSHEIRTPMNAIIGMANLLLESEQTENQRHYTEVLQSSGEMLLGIINDVLDLSKIEAGKMQLEAVPIDMDEFLDRTREIVAERARQKGLELHFELAPDAPERFVGDPVHLRQVLVNLIDNGVKFTSRGSVRLTIEPDRNAPPGRLTFTVADTGIGIPPEAQEQIFLRFTQADTSTTRKYGGTGLGLAISRRLVELMGGTIRVQSVPGQGSRFSFTLDFPVEQRRPVPAPPPENNVETLTGLLAQRECSILVAEDSDSNQALIELYFKDTGCRLEFAAHGAEAVDMFASGRYDMVLMDIQMPGMDGYEATRRIRAMEQERAMAATPIIAVTANAFREDQAQSLAAGCTDYLAKPVSKVSLLQCVVRHMKDRS